MRREGRRDGIERVVDGADMVGWSVRCGALIKRHSFFGVCSVFSVCPVCSCLRLRIRVRSCYRVGNSETPKCLLVPPPCNTYGDDLCFIICVCCSFSTRILSCSLAESHLLVSVSGLRTAHAPRGPRRRGPGSWWSIVPF